MSGNPEDEERPPVPPAPSLPDVESPPPEDVLEGIPSVEEIVEDAEPAEKIIGEQPGGEDAARPEDEPER